MFIKLFIFLATVNIRLAFGKATDILKGVDIRVSAMPIEGYLYIEKDADGNFTFRGVNKDYYDVVFDEKWGYNYHYVIVNATAAAARGFSQASIDQLLNGDVDVSILGYFATVERKKYMDFAIMNTVEPYAFLVPYPKEESTLWGPIRPFQSAVWITFFVSTCVVVIFLSLLNAAHRVGKFDVLVSLSDNAIYVITILISNAEYYKGKVLSLRLFLCAWCLMCVILINSYTGNLTSYLTFPALQPVPNSFVELADRKDLSVIIEDKTVLAEQMLQATSGALKVLGDSLRQNPNHLFRTAKQHEALLTTGHVVYPGIIFINYYAMAKYLKRYGTCGYTLSKPIPHFLKSSPALPKDSPYLEAFNTRIQRITEMGLMEHLKKQHMPRIQKCLLEKREKPKMVRLTLEAFTSAFLILLIGTALSLATFCVEYFIGLARQKPKPRVKV